MLLPHFRKGRGKLTAGLLNRMMDMLRWFESKEGYIQYKNEKRFEPRRNARGGVLPVILGTPIPINGSDDTTTQWEYPWAEAEVLDGETWTLRPDGRQSNGKDVPHALNMAEAENSTRPLGGTVAVSNGVMVGVEVLSLSTVTTWLLPIREGRPVLLRYYGARHWFDAGNDTDSSAVCNG